MNSLSRCSIRSRRWSLLILRILSPSYLQVLQIQSTSLTSNSSQWTSCVYLNSSVTVLAGSASDMPSNLLMHRMLSSPNHQTKFTCTLHSQLYYLNHSEHSLKVSHHHQSSQPSQSHSSAKYWSRRTLMCSSHLQANSRLLLHSDSISMSNSKYRPTILLSAASPLLVLTSSA